MSEKTVCGKKRCFDSVVFAQQVKRKMIDETGDAFDVYVCPYCQMLHVGHSRKHFTEAQAVRFVREQKEKQRKTAERVAQNAEKQAAISMKTKALRTARAIDRCPPARLLARFAVDVWLDEGGA